MIALPVTVVLASSSPARRDLMSRLVTDFRCEAPAVSEALLPGEAPEAAAVRLARSKARQVAGRNPACLVVGADTLVVCDGLVMGKPADRDDAVRMLSQLTRSEHAVVTGLAVITPDGRERTACVSTAIRMRPMGRDEIRRYCETPEVLSWAGAYALHEDDPNVLALSGSATGVMGLPLEALERLLCELYPSAEERCGTS